MAKRVVSVIAFVVHQLFCPYVLLVLSAFLTFTALPLVHIWYQAAGVRTAHWILTETPYYPVQISIALIAGFAIGKIRRIPFTRWMWVFPSMLLLGGLVFVHLQEGQTRLAHFFGWEGLPQFHFPQGSQGDQIFFTLPFYVSVAYSATAFLVQRRQSHNRLQATPVAI
jgi:hypothetical protein